MAQLTMGIADLYDDHLDQLDGDVLDAQAVQTCPETRDELVKAAGGGEPRRPLSARRHPPRPVPLRAGSNRPNREK